MATALDLLMSTKEDVNLLSEQSDICTIDAKTRIIFVPSTIVVGGVQSDKNAERIKFSCPKIVGDNLDLSKFSVRINFENVSSVDFNVSIKDQYICDDVAVDGENVTFSWLIGRNAARYMGTVRFIVCAVKTDSDSNISVEWNTAIAEVPVLEGIEIDQPQIGQEEKDVINQLLELTKNTSAEAVQNVNSAKEQAIKDIQSVSQPDTTLTIEGGLAEAKATGEAIGSIKEDLEKKLNCKGGYIKQEITVIKNALINSLEHTQYNSPTMENATVSVISGEKYRIKGWSVNTTYCGLALYNGKNTTRIISNTGAFDTEITIPDGITTMYVNGRTSDNPIFVSKFETTESDSFWLEYDLLVEKAKDTERRVDALEHKEVSDAVYKYGVNHISDGVIDVFLHKYDDAHDLNVGFKKKSGNNLPDFFVWQLFENTSNNVLIDKTGLAVTRTISQGDTDYLSPSTVYAANNGDGDFADFTSGKLTGGWHMYNSKTSGDYTATARNISCKVYCDGKEISMGEKARGNEIIVDIVNRLQGSNTEKSDGTGREIVEQHFRITFRSGNKVIVDGEITALEDILYANYYGVSYYFFTPQRTVPCYLVGDKVTRVGVLPSVSLHRSDTNCTAIRTITNTDCFEMGIDTSVDIGDFSNNRGWNMQISSLKAYPMLVMQTEKEKMLTIPKGGKVFWRGYYNCYPTISVN